MSLRVEEPPAEIPHGVLTFHPFDVRQEGDGRFLIGSRLTGKFFEIGPEGARAIELLQRGTPWQDVPAMLRAETGRDLDVKPFLRKLSANGFVRTLGPLRVWAGRPPDPPDPAPRGWRLLRHPLALVPLLAPALAGLALLARRWSDVPRPGALLLSADPLLYVLAFVALSWILTLGHEGAHYGLARSYGLASRIRLSTRMQTLVAETDVTQAWRLGKPQRAIILGGGLMFNAIVLGWAELALDLLRPAGGWEIGLRILLLASLAQMLFQALIFLRTDGYYLLVALGPERNLRARAFRALRASLRLSGPTCAHCGAAEPSTGGCALCGQGRAASPARRWALASFALLTIVLSAAFLALGLDYLWTGTLPFAQHLLALAQHGDTLRTRVEAAALIALVAAQLGLVVALAARAGRRRWRAWRRARASEVDAVPGIEGG